MTVSLGMLWRQLRYRQLKCTCLMFMRGKFLKVFCYFTVICGKTDSDRQLSFGLGGRSRNNVKKEGLQ